MAYLTAAVRRRLLPFCLALVVAAAALVGAGERATAQSAEAEAAPTETAAPAVAAPAAAPASPAAPVASIDLRVEEEARVVEADIGATLEALRQQMRVAVAASRQIPGEIAAALASDDAAEGGGWLLEAVFSAIAAIVAGLVVAIGFERLTMRHLPADPPGSAETEARVAPLVGGALLRLVGTAILVVVGFAVIEILDTGVDARHRTALILLVAFACARGAVLIVGAALSPPGAVAAMSADEAGRLRGWLTAFIATYAVVAALEGWLNVLGLSTEAQNLAAIALSLILAVLLSALCFVNRRPVAALLGTPPQRSRSLCGLIAANWWIVALAYCIVAWVTRGVHVLLGLPGTGALVPAPMVLAFGGLIVYGAAYLAAARAVPRGPVLWIGGPGGRRMRDYRDLADRGAGLVVTLVCFVLLAHVWGASFTGGFGGTLVKIAIICAVGWIVYDAVSIGIDRKHAREGGIPAVVAEDEAFAPLPPGKSRLATLLPLARIFILSAIVVVVVLMVLMELGVNVVPLFAGASIFGLAIGFGSQTLVRDLISGAFFLIDDAFRVGEYVDVGGGAKGTVEKISIRSFQLRHQRGPLHTIPFGDIKQVTNMSRDWAITKLPFSFPHGTDVEKVRKVIKKVGQELLDDPLVGQNFLEPVKSQGVVEMDSNGMTFAVKFTTPPLVQAMVTRAVNARLSQAFIAAGLEFASTTVNVRITSDSETAPSDAQKRAAAAAAVQAMAEGEADPDE